MRKLFRHIQNVHFCGNPFGRFCSSIRGASTPRQEKCRNRRMGIPVAKALLGLATPYTAYALYISLQSNREITARENKLQDKESMDFADTLIKYSQLEILGRFENPFTEYRIQTVYEFFFNRLVEVFERNRGGIPVQQSAMDDLMPVHKPSWTNGENMECEVKFSYEVLGPDQAPAQRQAQQLPPLHVTWLGQSCSYIVYRSVKILTDPLMSDYLLHNKLGPKRITKMPAQPEEVPVPDVILVSHNHPDHLDEVSMKKWGSGSSAALWIVPKGLGEYVERHGVERYVELSWWETCRLKFQGTGELPSSLDVVCTPAMHWSGRTLFDANRSLWASFLIRDKDMPVLFHAGDTGYVADLFLRIKERFGAGVKLALLPCGQYCPEWHQKPRHISPSEVLMIMKDMEAKSVLGVHWGTFVLSGEYFREPKEKLEILAEFEGVRDNCYCPELGKTITIY
ncbi:ABR187Cp [Eremothecium gossypii ATCC 10895]|uniref:ABR187Cp n=1 Tax=Eremothecium gossypii (strain ATCC 10895 / CBS 109.51 / FGSC 9923 / NRRL Y-1056) TaxID=284811 RepID=Q75D36_EREGS|nr:ABR187Cp [Eremothecium gossypii ATCC 10895]AAS50959.1 ABR187Cp [Eremothecium gossypii ATCC 10895]